MLIEKNITNILKMLGSRLYLQIKYYLHFVFTYIFVSIYSFISMCAIRPCILTRRTRSLTEWIVTVD